MKIVDGSYSQEVCMLNEAGEKMLMSSNPPPEPPLTGWKQVMDATLKA